jgi:uncharacterized protein
VIEIGKVNNLLIGRETDSGYYLKDLESEQEVFMPPSMSPIRTKINENLNAFVYLDTQGKLIATSETPYAVVGEYALMTVKETQDFGAFFDWGIDKDLLVPGNEQKVRVKNYEDYIVRVCLEADTNRVYGTTKLGKFIEESEFDIEEDENVSIVPAQKTDLGYRVIINKKFIGMIYDNEIFINIELGQVYQGVIKKIRDDGLLDSALQVQGIQNLVDAKAKILEMLEIRNGSSTIHDKSSPEEIKQVLGMSKKTFKAAIGMLYKDKLIELRKGEGIKLIEMLWPPIE